MKTPKLKKVTLAVAVCLGLAVGTQAFADSGSPSDPGSSAVVAAIQAFQSFFKETVDNANALITQVDKYLPQAMTVNTSRVGATAAANQATQAYANKDIAANLTDMATIANPSVMQTAYPNYGANSLAKYASCVIPFSGNNPLLSKVRPCTDMSDTLLAPKAGDPFNPQNQQANFPADDYLSLSSLIGTNAYATAAQQKAASAYLYYLGANNQQFNFADASASLSNLSGQKLTDALSKLRATPDYQSFVVNYRSYILQRALALNTFYHFSAERQVGLAQMASVDNALAANGGKMQVKTWSFNKKGELTSTPVAHPSPLQVEDYMANYRVQDPSWYQSIATSSPAALARENVLIQAQMLSKMQELHHDNERTQALLAALVLDFSQMSGTALQGTGMSNLKTAIDNIVTPPSSSSDSNSSS